MTVKDSGKNYLCMEVCVYSLWHYFCRCWDWQRWSTSAWSNKHSVDPRLCHQETVFVIFVFKVVQCFHQLCSLYNINTSSDLRREFTSRCPRSMPDLSCSNSTWVRPPTVSQSLISWLLARKQKDTRVQISASLSEMLSCSLFEKSSRQHTSSEYVVFKNK